MITEDQKKEATGFLTGCISVGPQGLAQNVGAALDYAGIENVEMSETEQLTQDLVEAVSASLNEGIRRILERIKNE